MDLFFLKELLLDDDSMIYKQLDLDFINFLKNCFIFYRRKQNFKELMKSKYNHL